MASEKKRICLFAGFDARAKVADYAIYYIKALSRISDVYYWGEFTADDSERAKLEPYCKGVYFQEHNKYDFGSWQELVKAIGREQIETYDEVILANDSCYGPLFDLGDLFEEMDRREVDFWGLSMAHLQHIHLQSYFMVLKKPVIKSDVFYDFLASVKPEKNHRMICAQYEQRFTYILNKAGFKFDALIPYVDRAHHPYYNVEAAICDYNFPLIKIKFFSGEIRDQIPVKDWRQMISHYSDFPVSMIEADLERRGYDLVEVDQILQENHDPIKTQILDQPKLPWFRKIIKKCVYRIGRVFDGYLYEKIHPYDLRDDALARSYRSLKQNFDLLAAQVNSDCPRMRRYVLNNKPESVNGQSKFRFALRDYTETRISPLPLPLTRESDILLIGNMSDHNLSLIGFDDFYPIYLNNLWVEDDHPNWFESRDLSDFSFRIKEGGRVWFDLILVQPFADVLDSKDIGDFIKNAKKQMIYEAVLVMLVRDDQAQLYQEILESEGLVLAPSTRGFVVGNDPFEVYYDKIRGIKGYKALIYKIK